MSRVQTRGITKDNFFKFVTVVSLVIIFILLFTGNVEAVGNHSMQETVDSSSSESTSIPLYFLIDLVYMFIHSPMTFIVTLIIIGVLITIASIYIKRNKEKVSKLIIGLRELSDGARGATEGLRNARLLKRKAVLADIQSRDPNFSEEELISKTQNIFMQLQEAWSTQNWKVARMYETDALFNVHNKQLEGIISKNRTNYVENITFVNTDIVEYDQDENNDIAKILFEVRLIDYTVDNETGKVVFGDKRKILHLKYLYTFIRSKNVVTEGGDGLITTNCPSCGAPMDVNASGECEYCGTVIVNGTYDWVVSNIESRPDYRV